jgi:arylsulfatase A-like enzyme
MSFSSASQIDTIGPNILLIMMDATRAKSLSCYGYHRRTTPNLERFAERCVVYETAISTAGWSLPAHASIFTGLYPSRHGAHDQHKYLVHEYPTIAELLRSQGYRTLAFCHNMYVGSATGLNRGFEWFEGDSGNTPHSLRKIISKTNNGISRLLGWRDSGARRTNKQIHTALHRLQGDGQPFFIFVHYGEPHAPYRPPRRYNCYLPDGVSLKEASQVNQDQWKYFINPASMDGQDFEILTALYDAEITYLDARIAEVLGWLKESGILDQTMVILTADHGENIGDHQMMGHAYCLYDTLVHVPLIVHYPRGVATPSRVEHQVQTLDILPTILAMLGDTSSDTYRSLQGYDLLSSTRRDFTVAEQAHPDLTTFYKRFSGVEVSIYDRALKMIRTDRYKYIWSSDGNNELYDLQADSDEQCNVIGENSDIADDLDRRLTEWRNSFEVATPSDQVPEFEEEVKARLRALGYLE